MNIAILTQPLRLNYGGLIQAYALQKTLENMGNDVVILNREKLFTEIKPDSLKGCLLFFIKRILQLLMRCPKQESLTTFYVGKNIRKFIRKYHHKSPNFYSDESLLEYVSNHHIDAYVVGSDQVWRPRYSPNIYNYFLDFTNGDEVIRISYAASFGVDNWEFSEKETAICKELIKRFDAISVRESSGIELCEKYLNCSAIHVLDPTLLLQRCDYEHLVLSEKERPCTGDLFCYILDPDMDKQNILNSFSKKHGFCLYYCDSKKFSFAPNLELRCKPRITRWLRSFMDARFVIADSFHGAVFCIIFNKPFVVIANKKRGIARFISLLSTFGLEDRLIYSYTEIEKVYDKPINWLKVNEIHSCLRKKSINFLKQELGKPTI